MDSAALGREHKADFDRDGFVLLRGFLSPAEARELSARFDRLIAERVSSFPATDAFYEVKGRPETLKYLPRLVAYDAYFDGLLRSDRFVKLAAALLGDEAVPQNIEWFNKCARVGLATPPHQDGYYYMLEPNEAAHFWLALDPVDEGNGCIRYVPGSHRRGVREHRRSGTLGFSQTIADYGDADRGAERPMVMQPGDMLVHHSLTIHRADANGSGRERRALGALYYAARAKVDRARSQAYQEKLMGELAAAGKI